MKKLIQFAIIALTGVAMAQTPPPPPPPAATPAPPAPATPAPAPRVRVAPRAYAYAVDDEGGSRSYLGVDVRDLNNDRISALKLKDDRGVEITMVDQDAPAGKAGLKEHDVIVTYNGNKVESQEQLRRMIRETPPGRKVALGIVRNGQPMTLEPTIGDRREMSRKYKVVVPPIHVRIPEIEVPEFAMLQYTRRNGVVVESLTSQLGEYFGVKNGEGVLVREIKKGTPAESSGLHAGDVIIKAGNERITSTEDWNRVLRQQRKGGNIPVVVMRERREQNVSLNIPERTDQSSLNIPGYTYSYSIDTDELARLGPEMEQATREWREKFQKEFEKNSKEWQKQQKEFQKEQQEWQKEFQKQQKEIHKELIKEKVKVSDDE